MAAKVNAEEASRAEAPPPNRKTNSTRNRSGKRIFWNSGASKRSIRYFAGETKEVEAFLTLVTEKVDKGVTLKSFQDTLKNYVLKA